MNNAIQVGAGTGISPMLGFLEARQKALWEGTHLGQCLVYFGCRNATEVSATRLLISGVMYVSTVHSLQAISARIERLSKQSALSLTKAQRPKICRTSVHFRKN